MDQLERSFQEEQAGIEESIRMARVTKNPYTPKGYCLSCYEDVSANKLYCDSQCASNHDTQLKLKGHRH